MSFFDRLKSLMKPTPVKPPTQVDGFSKLYEEVLLKPELSSQLYKHILSNPQHYVPLFMTRLSKQGDDIKEEVATILLELVHKMIHNQETREATVAYLKEHQIQSLNRFQNDYQQMERLTTETSTSSFMPPQQYFMRETPKTPNEGITNNLQPFSRQTEKDRKVLEKRKDKTEQVDQVPKLIIQMISAKEFIICYYQYILKLASSMDLFQAIQEETYPFHEDGETIDPKIECLWFYKIQNLQKLATPMITIHQAKVERTQALIFSDFMQYQSFMSLKLTPLLRKFTQLAKDDCKQIYEIHQEFQYLAQALAIGDKLHQFNYQTELTLTIQEQDDFQNVVKTQKLFKNNQKQYLQEQSQNVVTFNNHFRQKSGCPMLQIQSKLHKENHQLPQPQTIEQSVDSTYNPFAQPQQSMGYERRMAEKRAQEKENQVETRNNSFDAQ